MIKVMILGTMLIMILMLMIISWGWLWFSNIGLTHEMDSWINGLLLGFGHYLMLVINRNNYFSLNQLTILSECVCCVFKPIVQFLLNNKNGNLTNKNYQFASFVHNN